MKYTTIIFTVAVFAALTQVNAQEEQRRGPPRMQLTEEQRVCLENEIGVPGTEPRPTREEMDAAFQSCGIQRPERGHRHERGEGRGQRSRQSTESSSNVGAVQ